MQLDGYFYQNEGQYRVIDTSEYNWTSLPNKIVVGNEFNIVNAGYNNTFWFNYLPINDRNNKATISTYNMGNGQQGYAYVAASGFVKNGSNGSYVLLGDGGHAAISSLSVSYANSAGNASTLGGTSLGGLFTAFGNNAHNITATIGGVTKSFLVNYAADADKVDGVHVKWAGELTSTAHLVAWEADGSALRNINPANVTVGSANYASNADTVDGYHASQLAKAWSGSGTMNQVAQNNGNYFGMITGTGTEGFPNDDGGWTHVFQASYNNNSGGDGNTGNFWVTQIANQAGTTSPWIRSRRGGSDISTGWTDWVRIMTKNDVDNYYWADIKVSTSSNTQTTPTFNTAYATNWFRARGNTGFYFQDHAGGWYMSDNDWIRTWGSKALYVNNTIRSTNYQVMYGSTSVSAAKLESTTTLVYGTDTSSNSINSYLRGTTVTLQVKKGTSINHNALQLTADYIYCNNYCDMKYGAIVSGGNFTVNNNAYLAQKTGTKVGIGTGSPQYILDVADKMRADGYVHSKHDSDDAVLLAGGGYAQGVPVKYYGIYNLTIYSGAGMTTHKVGNFKFVTKSRRTRDGIMELTYTYPEGYSPDNTFIWAQGNDNVVSKLPVHASIIHVSAYPPEYVLKVVLTSGQDIVNGGCMLYFICF